MTAPDVIHLEADFYDGTGANYITTPITWEALEPEYVIEAGLLSYIRRDPAVILAAALELPEVKAIEAERDRLRAALGQIAEPCSVSVSDRTGPNGIEWRAMYEAWRAICVERVGIARAALTTKGEADACP